MGALQPADFVEITTVGVERNNADRLGKPVCVG